MRWSKNFRNEMNGLIKKEIGITKYKVFVRTKGANTVNRNKIYGAFMVYRLN